jgi:GT2 family glycosyltransferase/glycosyltransferase involved in cell wall biosynthesis
LSHSECLALESFASPFVDDDLFGVHLGGSKRDSEPVRLYLSLPLAARPDVSWFFDHAYHLQKYPDLRVAGVDPLIHFMRWGVSELRSPHPLIDLRHIRETDPTLLPEKPTIEALYALLCGDLIDPSPLFSLDYYRSQLDDAADTGLGLLRHFVRHGLLAGLRPHPSLDPIASYSLDSARTFDVRSALRHIALSDRAPNGGRPLPTQDEALEAGTKSLFRAKATSLLPTYGRNKLRFDLDGPPDLSVLMVLHDNFALTLQALASLRQSHGGAIELILVDSGSIDETRHIARYVTGARLVRFESNVGYIRGCNAGLELVAADVVLYLNNDVELAAGSVAAALARLRSNPRIGAVGGKIIRTHGVLQEAGCIVWRDGWTTCYLRDQSPLCPEANFVRDVDFCSAVFLLARTDVVRDCRGFDDAFAPAYYEDADLCLRIRSAGYRVVYDPSVVVHHLEYGSAEAVADVDARIAQAREIFAKKHLNTLRFHYARDSRAELFARSVDKPRGRILFIEDQVPLRALGTGFVRSNDIVRVMAELGYRVTVFPLIRKTFDLASVYADLPDTVEVMHDGCLAALEPFLASRRGSFDTIWIARTHNLDRVKPILERGGVDVLGGVHVVLDTEAITATRDARRHALLRGTEPFDQQDAIRRELANAYFCQSIVAVNAAEAQILRDLGLSDVHVLGHARALTLTPRRWNDRSGLLFIGAFAAPDSPNYDGLCWFVDEVLPLVERELGYETRLTIVGSVGEGVDLERFRDHPRITLRGDLSYTFPLYDAHRVFVAPTRYAAGVPYKVHEAASHGVPVVATEVLREQLGWENQRDLLAAKETDAETFAKSVVVLYRSEDLWVSIRRAAAERIYESCGRDEYEQAVTHILAACRS